MHEYVAQHYREGRLSALADALGYDASYLGAYIKRETARTFKQLVKEEWMRHASRMLRSSQEPIYEIAQSVGISNLTQFYRRFHEYAGMTPQEYRTSPPR
ncbi:helix-turn-helix domain-containing protein [Collinsella sp. An7]|uniref:helix-turn-helix transcriptional regulator n=1 Tax=Collinsella sp. An7 TaxID=1965651 RepID=UPI0013023EC2|nr:helix-turn-helix domain-containing protein [Collinsella sp. An7]